jgi:hypothetical protein
MTVHAYSGEDVAILRWEVLADPDDPLTGIIMCFATADEAEALLSGAGYQPAGVPAFVSRAFEKRTARLYTHPAASQVVLARRQLRVV